MTSDTVRAKPVQMSMVRLDGLQLKNEASHTRLLHEIVMNQAIKLSNKELVVCDFAFRDGPALGLGTEEAYEIAKRLIEQWDGSETILEIYNRTERWPEEVS